MTPSLPDVQRCSFEMCVVLEQRAGGGAAFEWGAVDGEELASAGGTFQYESVAVGTHNDGHIVVVGAGALKSAVFVGGRVGDADAFVSAVDIDVAVNAPQVAERCVA